MSLLRAGAHKAGQGWRGAAAWRRPNLKHGCNKNVGITHRSSSHLSMISKTWLVVITAELASLM